MRDLKKEAGELPKEMATPIGRDWHLLLAGVTFGFLCLAAARGILSQQSNEMKTYFKLGQMARYFDRLNSVVEILLKQDSKTTQLEKDVVQLVANKLLYDFSDKDSEESDRSDSEPSFDKSIVSEAVKAKFQSG